MSESQLPPVSIVVTPVAMVSAIVAGASQVVDARFVGCKTLHRGVPPLASQPRSQAVELVGVPSMPQITIASPTQATVFGVQLAASGLASAMEPSGVAPSGNGADRSEEHTSELQS